MPQKETIREVMAREELVRERIDKNGEKWTKKYFGGGAHLLNWLEQYKEVYGEKNVEVEEIDSRGFSCFEKGNEKMCRIWVREKK
jgi:type II secretory pathway component PulM